MNMSRNAKADDVPPLPWWRYGMVWLVVGGPLAVVVAACVTGVIAARGADIVVGDGAEGGGKALAESATPALQARNHATGAEKR